ncbi:MAG: TraR/DksA C4-type zinc finger protein [Actinobacteria bacterium]|jgi:RNA polymerase-binding protein DksA|nr:TraR/DksA C4-type zinc finger protein [Actinomycetota bacterium]
MDTQQVRKRLLDERTRLEGARAGLLDEDLQESEESATGELASTDQHADIASETVERETGNSILEQVEGELTDVDRALVRLDDGSYGFCEACGKPIGEARLEAVPTARFCVEDQAAQERGVRPAG